MILIMTQSAGEGRWGIIELTERQKKIIGIVKKSGPITSSQIADRLQLTRATLRPDLAILTMANILDAKPRVGYFFSTGGYNFRSLKELYSIKVDEIKAVPVVASDQTSVYDVIVMLFTEDVDTVFIRNDDNLLSGLVSKKDLLKITIGDTDPVSIPVSVIMTRIQHLQVCFSGDTLYQAASKMMEYSIDTLPVVETTGEGRDYKILGRISRDSILRAIVDFRELEI